MAKLSVTREGNGPECLFFVHGWPDDESLWDAQVAHLKQQFTCLRVTLPQFAGRQEAAKHDGHNRPWGFDFPEIADMIAQSIREECGGKPVTLVLHDLGCVWGDVVQQRHPELVKAVVAMDIGVPWFCKYGWASVPMFIIFGFVYQYWLGLAYMISQLTAGTLFQKVGRLVADSVPRLFVRILRPNARAELQSDRITADACFPYYWAQPWGLAGTTGDGTMRPSCPCLFFRGNKRLVPLLRFYSLRWEEELKSREDCEAVTLPCDHWLMIECAEAVNDRMQSWLEKTLR